MSKGTTIYHVQIGEDHTYFGSISAIYEVFTPDQLNVSKTTLWNYGITISNPYQNKHIIVRKGVLVRKKGNRGLTDK